MTKLVTIIIVINALSITCAEYRERELISKLNDFFNFDHNVFLLNPSSDFIRFINTRSQRYTPQSVYVFKRTDHYIGRLGNVTVIKSKNAFMILDADGFNFESNLNLITRAKEIQRLQINMKIGMFFSYNISIEDLHKLFEWCAEHRIINIFVASNTNSEVPTSNSNRLLSIFTFNFFGTVNVINVSSGEGYEHLFHNQNSNFQQHPLRLGAPFGETSDEKLWLAVFHVMNASFTEFQNNYTSREDFFDNSTIDIVPQLYIQYESTHLNMYPMLAIPMVILVPEAAPYTEFAAYLQTITTHRFFSYSLITVGAIMLLLIFFRYIKQKKFLFFQSVADVLNLLMNDNGAITYQKLSLIEVFLIVPLTFLGFVIVNGILSNLQSYLTQPILQPPIDTIEDIYRSPFPILTQDKFWQSTLADVLTNLVMHRDWNDKIHVQQWDLLKHQVETYNRSISFLATLNYGNSLLRLQKRLNIKGYHITPTHISKVFGSYPVHDEFPFTERLNEIFHWIQCAGLFELWIREDYSGFETEILENNLELLKNRKETDVETFPLPIVIFYGWFASTILFTIEIIWKNFKFSHPKRII